MDPALKHRLIGAAVLSALAIIFLPMLIVGRDKNSTAADVPLTVPSAPGGDFQTKELPLIAPASGVPDGGIVGMDTTHPAAPAATSPSVDANGQPLPAGVLPASSTSNDAASGIVASGVTSTAPVANAASPAVSAVVGAPTSAPSMVAAPTVATPSAAIPPMPQPAVAAASSAPIPAANAGGHYVVSLGTYSSPANAQSLVASLKSSQLPAYAEPVNVGGKMQTRVRIGPFAQRGDAEAARLKAQQVRTDMPASVTALDAATPAPDVPVVSTNKPMASSASAIKPVVPSTSATAKPVAPANAAPAANAAPSPAAAGRGYAVQVSAYRSEDEALTLRNKLRAAGFTAFSEKIEADSGVMYRVRVGPEADRDAADRLKADVSAKLGLNGMVVTYP